MANTPKGETTQNVAGGFVAAVQACDQAASNTTDKAREAAHLLVSEHGKKGEPTKEQHARLMEKARELIDAAKYELKNADLFSRYISPLVLCELEGDTQLKRKVKTDQGEQVTIERPVSELTAGSIKSAQKVAKELKEALGMSDGRANNSGKRKAKQPGVEPVDETAVIANLSEDRTKLKAFFKKQLHNADGIRMATEVLAELGFSLRQMSKLEREGLPQEAKPAPKKAAPRKRKAAASA